MHRKNIISNSCGADSSKAAENMNKQLQIKVEDTLVGKPLRMTLDMMILLVGMESSEGSRQMADTLGLNLAPNGFIKSQDPHYRNNNTNVEGVFVGRMRKCPDEPDRHAGRCPFGSHEHYRIRET